MNPSPLPHKLWVKQKSRLGYLAFVGNQCKKMTTNKSKPVGILMDR